MTNEQWLAECLEAERNGVEIIMISRQMVKKCHWCKTQLYADQIEEMGNARGFGEYIVCKKCGNRNIISETDLTREMF